MEDGLIRVLVILLLPIPPLLILVFPFLALVLSLSITAVEVIVVEVTRLVGVAITLSMLIALVAVVVIWTGVLVLSPARGGFPVPGRFLESGLLQVRSSFPVLDKPAVPTRIRHKPLLTITSPPSRPVICKATSVFRW